jgi:hypothetical protein
MKSMGIIISLLVSFSLGWTWHVNTNTVDYVNVIVWEKDRECTTSTNSEGHSTMSCRYVVHTDSETFENTDSLWNWKFNSSDVQRNLRVDEQACLKVVGYRIALVSAYRNIVAIADSTQCDSNTKVVL